MPPTSLVKLHQQDVFRLRYVLGLAALKGYCTGCWHRRALNISLLHPVGVVKPCFATLTLQVDLVAKQPAASTPEVTPVPSLGISDD